MLRRKRYNCSPPAQEIARVSPIPVFINPGGLPGKCSKLEGPPEGSGSLTAAALWRPLWPPGWHPRGGPTSSDPSVSRNDMTSDKQPTTSVSDWKRSEVEAWLDEHPAFVHDYFVRKAPRQVVDAWLLTHAVPQSVIQDHTTAANPQSPTSKPGSGTTTPVRKISACEFDKSGPLRPILNTTVDGTPTFLSLPLPSDFPVSTFRTHRKSRQELRALDERELIFELLKDICNELDVRTLCHKILQNISILTNADRCSLFLVKGEKDSPNRCLVSQIYDVSAKSTIEQMRSQEEIRTPWGKGIVGYVAETKQSVNILDCYNDSRFDYTVDLKTGYKTKCMLSMPIVDHMDEVIGVAQAINKREDGKSFDGNDEKIFAQYLQFCGLVLRNAQIYEKLDLENKRNQVLLDLARMVFEEQSTIEHIVYRIMTHMQSLLQCERCQILLVDEKAKSFSNNNRRKSCNRMARKTTLSRGYFPNTFVRVFDLEAKDLDKEESIQCTSPYEGRFPINSGITGSVVTTGRIANIINAYEDPRFDPKVDEGSAFKHRSILCIPIINASRQVVGVAQLINKIGGEPFNKNDEHILEAFGIFCGLGIQNTQIYEKVVKVMAKQRVTLEVLSYHASAPLEEAQRLSVEFVPSTQALKLDDLKFDDFSLKDEEMLKACIRVFIDLDFINRFHIEYLVLCRWLLSVKKNYRQVSYHNWRHAFNVGQMMFAILTNTQLLREMGELETFGLIVACFCHDLDHRGTNNSFQIKSCSPLAQLYSTSTMEHHHFDQCVMILNSRGNQILSHVSPEEYTVIVRVIEEAILATDLAVYFRKRGTFFQLVDSKNDPSEYNWKNNENRELLRGMLMTACDIGAVTKPWKIQSVVAELVTSEFFQQGDLEKEELKIQPIDMMNREKKDQLPAMQIGFIDAICLPIYKALAKVSHCLKPLLEGAESNKISWQKCMEQQPQQKSLSQVNGEQKDVDQKNTDEKSNPPSASTLPPPSPAPTVVQKMTDEKLKASSINPSFQQKQTDSNVTSSSDVASQNPLSRTPQEDMRERTLESSYMTTSSAEDELDD